MITLRILTVILALSLGGCVGRPAKFAPTGAHEIFSTDQLEAEWPQEWMTLRPAEKDEAANKEGVLLLLSRDGFTIQTMLLTKRQVEVEFKHTRKTLSAEMLPQEAAEVVLDNVRANPDAVDLHIVENSPATLAGAPGFKLNFTYRGKSGLQRQSVLYGCLDKGMLVTLSFDAPKRHYFPKDLPALEKVKETLRWKS
jgi:hypothetical protein